MMGILRQNKSWSEIKYSCKPENKRGWNAKDQSVQWSPGAAL